ncbi:hypothetical protein [Mesorhizobium xinjiangense]|uniref:hypothetical protein n=1 Tax=Mesorhizobium xinjiangense TaxID=2678685 RepID=UPI0012EE224D|nr:hypothetical protein [Mesorhizobium xinjiangense]
MTRSIGKLDVFAGVHRDRLWRAVVYVTIQMEHFRATGEGWIVRLSSEAGR